MAAKYVVGIDLGTTNTVVASAPAEGGDVEVQPIPQLVGPGEVGRSLTQLGSAVYLPAKDEFGADAVRLPWGAPAAFDDDKAKSGRYFLGRFAQTQGAKVPGRLIVSAKSWLSYAAVDRRAAILPWGGLDDVPRLSPVEVSARILAHVQAAWDEAHPDAPLAAQDLIVTVPASFDEIARNLTVEAAERAGLGHLRLLEEPQAAFYNWIREHDDQLVAELGEAKVVLVVDVGGGTTDLTLVQVVREEGQPPRLERIAVGEHLMLGGDNMDATLGRYVEQELTGSVGSLSAAQWSQLVASARLAKEGLLGEAPPEAMAVSLIGRGRKLLGGSKSHDVTRQLAEQMLLDGFFPTTAPDDVPARKRAAALTALSLPYAQEPAVPKHIAAFLRRHADACAEAGAQMYDGMPRPDAVLLNGGVFRAARIRERMGEVFAGWFGEALPFFEGRTDHVSAYLDDAVAVGAAYYGLVRRGLGVRIGGGSPRAYFVGVQDEDGTERALCVAPRGMIEGAAVDVDRTFTLTLGKPVSFPLLTTTSDVAAGPGELVDVGDELHRLPPIQTVLTAPDEVPVRLRAHLTEIGTLQLSVRVPEDSVPSWRLDFSTRAEGEASDEDDDSARREALPARMDEAKDLVATFFGNKAKDVDPAGVKQLRRRLEKILGPRETWSLAASRELFGTLIAGAKRRRRSADHERVFFQIAGWTLRPGFGAPLDDWRVGELWSQLFEGNVQYVKDKPCWAAYWLMWRRVAGGLDGPQQEQLYERVRYFVTPQSKREGKAPKGPKPAGLDEMIRMVAALERLDGKLRAELGGHILHRIEHGEVSSWWPLGRVGARRPLKGSAHAVVPARIAEDWLEELLTRKWKSEDGAAFAAAQIARQTGDRELDIDEALRARVARKLEDLKAPEGWVRMVREIVDLTDDEEAAALGDTLPVGLKL
jgi:molecular chaperone DnaK (HSP70)